LRGLKRDLYEDGIRVPLIARWPEKIKPVSTTDHVSASWDILPTCAELASVSAPEEIDGLSMVPTLLGRPRDQEKHESLYWEFKEKHAVRMGDWKAVRLGGEDGRLELYDLKSDTGEKHDLSKRHPQVITRIKKILKKSHDDSRN
jgi:arylsulfatase A